MNGTLTLAAALLLGLAASGHCVVMCGGISAALGLATARGPDGRPRRALLVAYQFGRISSYAAAGLLLGGALGAMIGLLDIEIVRLGLRVLAALVLLFAALVAFGLLQNPRYGLGNRIWPRLAPLGRRLLPVDNPARAFAFGMVWGWMPCGFVYTVLLIATLQLDALQAAATMFAFGLGTTPAMLATSFGAQRIAAFTARPFGRRAAGVVLSLGAALTLAGPLVIGHAPWMHAWLPFDCTIH